MVKYLNIRVNNLDNIYGGEIMACKISGSVSPIIKGENESVIKFAAAVDGYKDNHYYELFLPSGYRKEIIALRAVEEKIDRAGDGFCGGIERGRDPSGTAGVGAAGKVMPKGIVLTRNLLP